MHSADPDRALVTEEDIRSRILLPYLEAANIGLHNVRLEHQFRIRLGHTVVEVGTDRKRDMLAGRADVLVVDDRGRNLFVVEVKASDKELTDADRDQGISYARLLDEIAPFVLVTNGREDRLYDTITKERLLVPNESAFWRSGCDPAMVTDDHIRYDALRHFIGYSDDNVRAFSLGQQQARMRSLRGLIGEPRRYLPEVYVRRRAAAAAFDRFVESQHVAFAITGDSGSGKTNEMCALAERSGEKQISLFFNAAEVFGTFTTTLADEFNWHFSEHLPLPQIVLRLDGLSRRTGRPVLLFIDALDEAVIPGFEREISDLAHRLQSCAGRIKLIVSVKREDWMRFAEIRGNPSALALGLFPTTTGISRTAQATGPARRPSTPEPFVLERMSRAETDEAVKKYTALFSLPNPSLPSLGETVILLQLLSKRAEREHQDAG